MAGQSTPLAGTPQATDCAAPAAGADLEQAAEPQLDAGELLHLRRMLRRERLFPVLVAVDLAAAGAIAIHAIAARSWEPTRIVLAVLILLAARANLRQARSARLLRRLASAMGIPAG